MNIGEMELAQRIYKRISATTTTGEPITTQKDSLELSTANTEIFSFVPKLSGNLMFESSLTSSPKLIRVIISVFENNQKVLEQTYVDGADIDVPIYIKPYHEYVIKAKKTQDSDEGKCSLLFPKLVGYVVDDVSRYIAIE